MLIQTQPLASTSSVYTSPSVLVINGQLASSGDLERSGGRVKKFGCEVRGCGKAYTRPVRLEEHVRTHTGERPFACPSCPSTFARDSHLKAHVRTHADAAEAAEAKKYACDRCDKKFWTGQHLRKHVEVVHEGKTYDCDECQLPFRKHHLLRTHIAEVHSTPGTKPFPCTHDACSQSFRYPYELKAHLKTHDTSRYQCIHPACSTLPLADRQHATWSALQKHTKAAHPPTCPHPECEGKTFTTPRGLKWHLEVHDRNEGDELPACRKRGRGKGRKKRKVESDDAVESGSDWEQMESEREGRLDDSLSKGAGKRRKVDVAVVDGEVDASAPFACGADKCDRRFKSAGALETHTSLRHSSTPIVARPQRSSAPKSPAPMPASTPLVELLTGTNYASTRRYACPYPAILSISQPLDDEDLSDAEAPRGPEGEPCEYRFGKVYDVERHLRSWHCVEVHREELREWLEGEE